MKSEPLDYLPLWGLFLAACAVVWLTMECGYRLGKWRHAHAPEEKDGPVGAMVASILGLLAFMLAFTFSLAASRFDARRQVVLDEANAIGTTYLRTRLLPEPQRSEIAKLLRDYVDVRVPDSGHGMTAEAVKRAIARSEELHEQIWSRAMAAVEKSPTVMTAQFLQPLNEMIDLHAKRVLVGARSRIPVIIWLALTILAVLGMTATGYQAGLAATRRSPAMVAVVLAFAGVLFLIADLDRPGEGLITTSHGALIDLQRSMKTAPP
jgi:hypothetical protein